MEPMGIIAWIVVGLIAGWLASKAVPSGLGLMGDTAVGMVGAFVGGWIFEQVGSTGTTGFSVWSVFVAFVGAVVLLVVFRALNGNSRIFAR